MGNAAETVHSVAVVVVVAVEDRADVEKGFFVARDESREERRQRVAVVGLGGVLHRTAHVDADLRLTGSVTTTMKSMSVQFL